MHPAAEASFYDLENPSMESMHSDVPGQASHSEGSHVYNSVIFSPDKGEQRRGHYQQTVPVKWTQPDSSRQPGWTQEAPVSSWSQNIASYLGGINMNESRMQPAYPKSMLEEPLQQQRRAPEKQLASSLNAYRDSVKPLGVEWQQQQAVASLQHVAVQQGHAPVLQSQPLAVSRAATGSVLQPFQVAFGQPKQPLARGFYQVFQDNRTLPNLNYSGQQKFQNQFQQQDLLQNQQLQQQQQQIPHKQQEMQDDKRFLSYFPGTHTNPPPQQPSQALGSHTVAHEPASQPPAEGLASDVQKFSSDPQQPSEEPQPGPRRSRRLSKEGAPPAVAMPGSRPAHGTQASLNGDAEGVRVLMEEDVQAAAVGVIKSTHRKRRVSQEVNLQTLAQKASEMESLPSHSMTVTLLAYVIFMKK